MEPARKRWTRLAVTVRIGVVPAVPNTGWPEGHAESLKEVPVHVPEGAMLLSLYFQEEVSVTNSCWIGAAAGGKLTAPGVPPMVKLAVQLVAFSESEPGRRFARVAPAPSAATGQSPRSLYSNWSISLEERLRSSMDSPLFERLPTSGPTTPVTPESDACAGFFATTRYPPAGMMVPLLKV